MTRNKRRVIGWVISERHPDRKLYLPRRSRFAGGKAGPRDLAERCAADDVTGRTEIWMVEQIEHIHAELQAGVRTQTRSS